jgi:hypothetical protein
MVFNDNPTPAIPYGVIQLIVYKWYAGTYWAWSDQSKGDRDGTLTTFSFEGNIFSIVLEAATGSIYNQFEDDTYRLTGSGNSWSYTRETNGRTYHPKGQPPPQSFVHYVIAHPEYINGQVEFLSFKVYDHTENRILAKPTISQVLLKPQIKDYFTGYVLDSKPYKLDIDIYVIPIQDGSIKLHYYYLEDEEDNYDCDGLKHRAVSIQTQHLKLVKDIPHRLLVSCIPCSITLDGNSELCDDIKAQIKISNIKSFPDYLPTIKSSWEALYEQRKNLLIANPKLITTISLEVKSYIWAATPRWGQVGISDRNTGQGIGETINDTLIFDKYFKPQLDGTFGSYTMPDTAMLKNISATLDADKWSFNYDDPTKPRVDNLGWRINRLCDILGIRVNTDGTINSEKDKKLVRQVIDNKKYIDPKKIGVTTFGELGMVVKRINNRFKNKDEIVSDQCVIIQDIPQQIQEYFEQINLALGIQESSAIEIKQGDTTARFNSQLEILIELVNLLSSGNEMTRAGLISTLITQSQTNELIAGLGLPSVTKTIPIKIDKKVHQVPFKGIAAHRSISQEIATCTYNVGIATGQLL